MDRKILTYDSVEISFGGKAVVHDVSFSLEHGEILGLVGESGSGKSTLIKAAMGLLGPDGLVTRGDIRYMDQNILDIPEKEKRKIRGAGIGMIFQDAGASLCPIRTIGEQIYESMCAHTKITRSEAKTRAMDLFDKLNFKDSQRVWDSYPFELSGGMKEMLKLRELFGTAIVIVTHDIGVVRAMADTVLVLKNGKTVEYGTADRVLDHPRDPYTRKLLEAVPKLQRKVRV